MKIKNIALATIVGLGLSLTAQAGFVNGGFESGDYTGWTVEHGIFGGGPIAFSAGGAGHNYIIGPGPYVDPYSPFDTPFNGTYMARLNEFAGGQDATRLSQTATMLVGETDIFINWGAVLEHPTSPLHITSEQPFFDIDIFKNNVQVATESHTADQGVSGGWTAGGGGPNGSPVFYKAGQFHLAGLVAGDIVKIQMTVADCALSGHSGWAYLDGIGTVAQPPPPGVPDSGSSALLMLLGLLGLGAYRAKVK